MWLSRVRQKADTYIKQKGQDFQQLNQLELVPRMKRFITGVKLTKTKGFGSFNLACYCQRKYRGKPTSEPGYILTNLGSLKEALTADKARSGIEAM